MTAADFRRNFHPAVLLPSLTAGAINAIIMISVEISFAALIFSGDLQPFLARGIGIMLLGTLVVSVIIALSSSLAGMVGLPQDTPAALMGLVAAGIALTLKGRDPETIYATTVGAMMLGSLVTGALFIALGRFKASSFVRYVPYPVVGGFLAGTGFLLAKGGLGLMVALPSDLAGLAGIFAAGVLWHWLPGALLGLGLYLVLRRSNHFLIMPGAVLAAIGVFYAVLFLAGGSTQQAGADGWLLGPFPAGGLFRVFTLENLAQVQWGAIFTRLDTLATLFGLSVISLLLNASGLEVIYKQDIDLDRELVAAGGATLAAGLLGCMVGYQTLSLSALAKRIGAGNRLSGVFAGLFCGLALFLGASAISFFPKPVLGGLLFMLGLSFMVEWLVDSFKSLPRTDYLLIWVMLLIIATVGFLQAVGVGVVIAALLFVASYGSVSAVKNTLSGSAFHSRVERSQRHTRLLAEQGAQIHILRLQGFIFFGSIQHVLHSVHARLARGEAQPLKYLVLDFEHVGRLDSSALFGITRIRQLAEANGIAMAWTGLSDDVRRQLQRGGLISAESGTFSVQPALDYGLEWCEDRLLAGQAPEDERVDFVRDVLAQTRGAFPGLERVREHMQRIEVPAGEYLIRQGEDSRDLFFIESGLLEVVFETSGGHRMRLRTVQSGATVGEISLYLGGLRSASVRAERASSVYRLTAESLHRLQEQDPALAALLHEWLGHLFAERLVDLNRTIEFLLD